MRELGVDEFVLEPTVSDPAQMAIVRTVVIPGTVQAVGLSIQGNRAFVVASQGGWSDPSPANDHTGNLVLATLDITDPRNPSLLHSEVLDRPSAGPFSMRTTRTSATSCGARRRKRRKRTR